MEATKEDIVKWFREEHDSELLVDTKWMVQESEDGTAIYAKTDDLPFGIGVEFIDGYAKLILYTGLETATMSKDERLELYRKLLILNDESDMVKAILWGRDDEIALRTDLDLKSLSKEEFNDAIISIIVGAVGFQKIVGVQDEDEEEEAERIIEFVLNALQTKSEEEVVQMLVEQGGIEEEDAKEIVQKIEKEFNQKPPENMYG